MELHINDPDFYDEIYVGSAKRKTNKWWLSVKMYGLPDTTITTLDHDLHRKRRNAYASYFSKQSVKRLEPVVQSAVDKLCSRFEESRCKGDIVNMWHAYSALTADIISGYCFRESYDVLALPEFAKDLSSAMMGFVETMSLLQHISWLLPVMSGLPIWIVKILNPDMAMFLTYRKKWFDQITHLKAEKNKPWNKETTLKPSLFDAILDSDLPESEKSTPRITDEAQLMVAAGILTTTGMLTMSTYYILNSPAILASLMDELNNTIIDPFNLPTVSQLEKLPYLNAIVYEGLRMSYGTAHRLQRIAPDNAIPFEDFLIPPSTPVGMTTMLIHDSPDIFPDPFTFKPERWLPIETEGQRLQKYLVSFSRGTRICLGMNLANAEMLTTLAGVFRRIGNDMNIFDTIRERDIDITRDFFAPCSSKDSTHLKVKFEGRKN